MNDQKWAYKSTWRKTKAILFTVLFHLGLIAGIAMATDTDLEAWVPDFVFEWLETNDTIVEDHVEGIRP